MSESVTSTEVSPIHSFLTKLERRFSGYAWLIPVLSFAAGCASFILVQRGEGFARGIALLALVGWVWILAEPLIMNRLLGSKYPKLSTNVANFFSQSIQQEILFFALPFLFIAMQLESFGQIAFTGFVVGVAFLSTVDPWYEKYISRHRLISFTFHALCCFVSALVILPIVVKLPTEKTLLVALGFLVVYLVMTMPRLLREAPTWKSRGLVFVGLCFIPIFIWVFRASIPAAGLQATSGVITSDVTDHEPIDVIQSIDKGSLANGIYAHVAIKAPHGLAQNIAFRWHKEGYSETIEAKIAGGREEGYRTYSVKSNFPDSAAGTWSVDVLTAQGQLLKHLEFAVTTPETEKE